MVIGPAGNNFGTLKSVAEADTARGRVSIPCWNEKINEIVVFGTASSYPRYAVKKALSWFGIGQRPVKANLVFPSWHEEKIFALGFDEIEFAPQSDLREVKFSVRFRNLKTAAYQIRAELRPGESGGAATILCDDLFFAENGEIAEVAGIPLGGEKAVGMTLHVTVVEVDTGRTVYTLDPVRLKKISGPVAPRLETAGILRRLMDLGFGLTLLAANLVLAPLMVLLTACFISRRIFYTVERPGPGGRFVKVWKYRTMPTTRIARISEFDPSYFPKTGICIRALGLDELPQCLNILKGEWQVFGPRSVNIGVEVEGTPLEAHEYNAEIYGGLKPGLFNLTSALMGKGKDAINLPTRLRYERYHQRYRTGRLDAKIFVRSVMEILLLENVEDYLPAASGPVQAALVPEQDRWVRNAIRKTAAAREIPLTAVRVFRAMKNRWVLAAETVCDADARS